MSTILKFAVGMACFVLLTALWIVFMLSLNGDDTPRSPKPASPPKPAPALSPAPTAPPPPPPKPACVLDDWRYKSHMGILTIEGATSCATGTIRIRLYDKSKFLGATTGYIRGYQFVAMTTDIHAPSTLTIRYTIERR